MKKTRVTTRNAKWHEASIRKLIKEGLNREQIAIELNMSSATLANYCRILKVCIPRKKGSGRDGVFTDEEMPKVIELRKGGATLDEIGRVYGVSRERVRQVLAKKAPDVAIQTRARYIGKTCSICGKEYHHNNKTCSAACAEVGKKRDKWDRNRMLVALGLRNKGYTWYEVWQQMGGYHTAGSFRIEIERHAKWLMSTEEFNHTFKKRCDLSTSTDSCASEDTKEKDQTKPLPDGLNGPERTCLDSLVSWMRSRL